jgi:hypothetical protein
VGDGRVSFRDLPIPAPGRLNLYVLGPGFGESQILVAPGPVVVVVDSCGRTGSCLTADLLDHLEIERVDLLVVTHPDLDHVAGLKDLIQRYPPRHAWRYPFAGSLRDLAASWLRADPEERRLLQVHEALVALDELQSTNRAFEVAYGFRSWARDGLEVACLAPTPHDQYTVRRALTRMVATRGGRSDLDDRLRRYLQGSRGSLGDHPNLLSLALAVQWNDRRLVLGGDVSTRTMSTQSGWAGIMNLLREQDRLHLVTDACIVKASHHGSSNGFHLAAWRQHAKNIRTIAVTTPFAHGGVRLPRQAVLKRIHHHAKLLVLTSDSGGCDAEAIGAGWVRVGRETPCEASCMLAVIESNGEIEIHCGGSAAEFTASEPGIGDHAESAP